MQIYNRKIEELLREKLNSYRKPILLTGARQVGKTTVLKNMSKDYNTIYINLENDVEYLSVFEGSLSIEQLIIQLEFISGRNINYDTLIIIDEIQVEPRAITSLKYFAEDGRYKVIGTGSFLGVTLFNKNSSFPVGKVDLITMYPMDFEEFLNATSNQNIAKFINDFNFDKPIPEAIHNKCLEIFDIYMQLGGYPEVTRQFIENGVLSALDVQQDILDSYRMDTTKYASKNIVSDIWKVYSMIPSVLGREKQKFKFSDVSTQGYRGVKDPMHWLIYSNLAIACYQIESPLKPLYARIKENSFKLYVNDTGLLLKQSGYLLNNVVGDDRIYLGMIVENYVANIISKYYHNVFYYQKNTAEVDFLIETINGIIPIEVKAGNNKRSKSLNVYMHSNKPVYAIRVSRHNYGFANNIKSIPIYLIDKYLSDCLKADQEQIESIMEI